MRRDHAGRAEEPVGSRPRIRPEFLRQTRLIEQSSECLRDRGRVRRAEQAGLVIHHDVLDRTDIGRHDGEPGKPGLNQAEWGSFVIAREDEGIARRQHGLDV